MKEIDFLGFHIAKNKVRPCKGNIQKLLEFPTPKTKKQVQRFMGIANFNRRFVSDYAGITKPLTSLLSDKVPFVWKKEHQEAMDKLIAILSKFPALGLPDFSKTFYIQTDASDIAVGGVLFQYDNNNNKVVLGYHSKTFKKSQKNWKVTEKEMFAIKECCSKWDVYCKGKVIFITDHEPLKYIRKHKDNRGKIVRWLLDMESIDYVIEYVKGSDNEAADALSRMVSTKEELYHIASNYCDIDQIKKKQRSDKQIIHAIKRLQSGSRINKGPFRNVKFLKVEDSLLKRGNKVVVPESMQQDVTVELHGQHHLGKYNITYKGSVLVEEYDKQD